VPEARHVVEQYANNPIEADHGHEGPDSSDARLEAAPLHPQACSVGCYAGISTSREVCRVSGTHS
jgi:hypothetical protein